MNAEDLLKRSAYVFGKHDTLLPLWQDIADNFYVERADFTLKRSLNTDFAGHLTSSFPLSVRRELGDQISAMTRPKGEQWMDISVDVPKLSVAAKQKLDEMTKIQFRAMYDRKSGFVRATKEGDHDFATFGQCVISVDPNWQEMVMNYQTWHLRDVAWCVDAGRQVCEVHRKWRPTILELQQKFAGSMHPKLNEKAEKESPYCEVECLRVVLPAEQYLDKKEVRKKYVHLTLDVENRHLMETVQRDDIGHVIPRWQTVSGSQYAFSPATVIALPDARLIQSMALSMLEAGEMAVRPPLLAASDSIREDIQYFAGGITKADIDNDRQLKDVLAPIFQDKSGYSFGLELSRDTRDMIANAFYINKLSLPPSTGKETAYEISQRVQQYIRQALPLFEPLEEDYNGQLCEQTFDILMSVGAFGPVEKFPEELQGREVRFKFHNPLQAAIDSKSVQKWREAMAITGETLGIDPNMAGVLKPEVGLRAALEGNRTPIEWLATEDEMLVYIQQKQAEQQAAKMLQGMGAAASVAEQAGKANKALEGAV